MHGLRFLNIEIRLIDYDDIPPFEVKIILDTLYSNTPALSLEQNKALFESVGKDYEYIPNKRQRMEAIKKDPYLNALQVKFAYCLTTHKAQGGQWPCVFVDQGYLKDEQIDKEFIRWLYTAITRSSHELFLVNFNDKFFLN
jgi:exodeoxyribonuclease-5